MHPRQHVLEVRPQPDLGCRCRLRIIGLSSEGSGAEDPALDDAPALALGRFPHVWATSPNPAWRPKPRRHWPLISPTLHRTVLRAAPEPPRSLAVVPSVPGTEVPDDEAPGRQWRNERAAGDAIPPIPTKTAKRCADQPPRGAGLSRLWLLTIGLQTTGPSEPRRGSMAQGLSSLASGSRGGLGAIRESASSSSRPAFGVLRCD